MTKLMESNQIVMKNSAVKDKSIIVTEEEQGLDLPISLDSLVSIAISTAIPYAIFEFAVKTSSYNGGPAISHALKAIGPGGVKSGIVTMLLGAVTTYVGTQKMLSFIGGKVLEADYAKGEKTKEELIEHISRLPISNTLQDSLIRKVKKFW
jgi:hypothetical protein